jgi:hypothetical protein
MYEYPTSTASSKDRLQETNLMGFENDEITITHLVMDEDAPSR